MRCGADHWRDGPHAPPLAAFELQHEHVAVVGVRVDGAGVRRREVHVGESVGHVVAQRRTQRMHAGAATLGVVHDERGTVKVGGGSTVVLLRRVLVLKHDERACARRGVEYSEEVFPRGHRIEGASRAAATAHQRRHLPVL